MLDAEKLKELQAKNIICEQEFVEQKHNLFNRIMRHENNPKAKNGIIYILLAWFVPDGSRSAAGRFRSAA